MSHKSIRILPMDKKNEFPKKSYQYVQEEFFLKKVPERKKDNNRALYCFKTFAFSKDTPLNNETLILFQFDAKIIAMAELEDIVNFASPQGVYNGYYIFNPNSICIFDPIDSISISKVFEKRIAFSQVKHKLDPSKFDLFNDLIKNKKCVNIRDITTTIELNCIPI